MSPGRPEVFTFHDLVLENEASGWPQDRRSAPHPGVGYPPIDDRHALNNFVSLPAPPSTAPSTSRGDHERRAINERQLRRRCEITQSTCPRNRIRPTLRKTASTSKSAHDSVTTSSPIPKMGTGGSAIGSNGSEHPAAEQLTAPGSSARLL